MCFGNRFFNAINAINTNPTAVLKVNNFTLEAIQLEKGTRQGCPLSPLLFALVVEPLACKFRTNTRAGVTIGNTEHKIGLYADDIVLYLTNLDIELYIEQTHCLPYKTLSKPLLKFLALK